MHLNTYIARFREPHTGELIANEFDLKAIDVCVVEYASH